MPLINIHISAISNRGVCFGRAVDMDDSNTKVFLLSLMRRYKASKYFENLNGTMTCGWHFHKLLELHQIQRRKKVDASFREKTIDTCTQWKEKN